MSEVNDTNPLLKLEAYKEQLAQIEAYLTSDQTNPEWLKCKRDIENVIKMTETLIHVQNKESQSSADLASSGSHVAETSVAPEAESFQAITAVQLLVQALLSVH